MAESPCVSSVWGRVGASGVAVGPRVLLAGVGSWGASWVGGPGGGSWGQMGVPGVLPVVGGGSLGWL